MLSKKSQYDLFYETQYSYYIAFINHFFHVQWKLLMSSIFIYSLHWNEALYGFSLAYVICQHHYSYALGPLLSNIESVCVWECKALRYPNSWSNKPDRHLLSD